MATDQWFDWLLHHRHGDDPGLKQVISADLEHYAEHVLDGVSLRPGMTLLDVGAGDGLIGFRAIERIGPSLNVVMTDVSESLMAYLGQEVIRRGVSSQCRFLNCPADNLSSCNDGSVDAVTTRSVLAYVENKDAAVREFFRVLKPGGHLSIVEPLFREDALEACVLRAMVDMNPADPDGQAIRVLHRVKAAQFPDTPDAIAKAPHTNYSERDLLALVQRSGFIRTHLELHIDTRPMSKMSWSAFIGMSPHPWAPPLGQILEQQLSPAERELYERRMRPAVERGEMTSTSRMVYVTAERPPSAMKGSQGRF